MKCRTCTISTSVAIALAVVLVNVWAGSEARMVPAVEQAAVATAGLIDTTANKASHHLVSAREGFFFFRAWHWMRYNQLTA